jgi:hypothetical protein
MTGHRQITRTLQRNAADRTRILPILASFPLPAMIHSTPDPQGRYI